MNCSLLLVLLLLLLSLAHNKISCSFPLRVAALYLPSSFEDVILLIPVACSEREPKEGYAKISIVESVDEWVDLERK
jgi:hypothetical protein